MTAKLVSTAQAAVILDLKPNTLEGWRVRGVGPTYRKIGRLVKYHVEDDLLPYINRQARHSTSQEGS